MSLPVKGRTEHCRYGNSKTTATTTACFALRRVGRLAGVRDNLSLTVLKLSGSARHHCEGAVIQHIRFWLNAQLNEHVNIFSLWPRNCPVRSVCLPGFYAKLTPDSLRCWATWRHYAQALGWQQVRNAAMSSLSLSLPLEWQCWDFSSLYFFMYSEKANTLSSISDMFGFFLE